MHDNNIKSIIFRHNLLNAVRSATRKVFNVAALTVKVRKQNNLFLIELAQLFGHNHIIMRIGIFQLYNVMIPPKIVGYLPIQRSRSKTPPVHLLALHHQFIRFGNASI